MFPLLPFSTPIFPLIFYLPHIKHPSLLFFPQTLLFLFLSYFNLSQTIYIYIF
ncbi:DUF2626 family protein, partial [Bacillus sp. WP8]|uniref:DUF2626 family protein n=1 Tax=Bacillus sp. WP8 TaxID=756828 RepID=UPI0021B60CA0